MVSRSSHTSHECLILVIQVTNVSSAIEQKVQKRRQLRILQSIKVHGRSKII